MYLDVCSDVVFGDVCNILLPTIRLDIFGSLLLLVFVTDGRVLVFCHNLYHSWTLWRKDVILIV